MSLSEEQLALRRTGIGSSEIAAVVGLSKWPVIDVWRSKVDPNFHRPDNPAMRRGRLLEAAVAAWYADETGAELVEPGTVRHPNHPLCLATPDRLATLDGQQYVLELKTSSWRDEDWGEPGTDQVPPHYLLQVAWEMAAADVSDRAELAVLIAGHDFRVYRFGRDAELEASLIQSAERWWRDYVVTGRPPPPDASEEYAAWLRSRYPRHEAPMLQATPAIDTVAGELCKAERELSDVGDRVELLRNELRALIGDAEGVVGSWGKVTWRAAKDSARTDWRAVAEALEAPKELIKSKTAITPGSRRFLATWRES